MATQTGFLPLAHGLGANQAAVRASLGLNLPVQVLRAHGGIPLAGVMDHLAPGVASIKMDSPLLMDTNVQVECHGFQFAGEVVFCECKDGLYEIHVSIFDVDELGVRRSPRYAVNLPAKVYGADADGCRDVTLVDISKDGLGLESCSPFSVNEAVCIESELCMAFATVRHCRQVAPGRFRSGLEVQHAIAKELHPEERPPRSRWSRFFAARGTTFAVMGAIGILAAGALQFWR